MDNRQLEMLVEWEVLMKNRVGCKTSMTEAESVIDDQVKDFITNNGSLPNRLLAVELDELRKKEMQVRDEMNQFILKLG